MSLTCHIAMSQCLTQKEPVKYTSKLILGINLHPFDCLVTNNFLCLSSTKRNIVSLPAEKKIFLASLPKLLGLRLQCQIFYNVCCDARVIVLSLLRYDTRCYFNVRSKADMSQLNLPHGTNN